MKTVLGVVTVVQETRFRLETDEGQGKLFLLSPDAPIEPQDLPELQRRGARVAVAFSEPSHLIAGVAHDIRDATPAPPAQGEPA